MHCLNDSSTGRFCWIDLAASDATRAQEFYTRLFGWTVEPQRLDGGEFQAPRAAAQGARE